MVENSVPVVASSSSNFPPFWKPKAFYPLRQYPNNLASQNEINSFFTLISYLYWVHFNIILKAPTRFNKVPFVLDVSQLKFLIHFPFFLSLYFLFFLNFIIPILFYEKLKLWSSSRCTLFICLFSDSIYLFIQWLYLFVYSVTIYLFIQWLYLFVYSVTGSKYSQNSVWTVYNFPYLTLLL